MNTWVWVNITVTSYINTLTNYYYYCCVTGVDPQANNTTRVYQCIPSIHFSSKKAWSSEVYWEHVEWHRILSCGFLEFIRQNSLPSTAGLLWTSSVNISHLSFLWYPETELFSVLVWKYLATSSHRSHHITPITPAVRRRDSSSLIGTTHGFP